MDRPAYVIITSRLLLNLSVFLNNVSKNMVIIRVIHICLIRFVSIMYVVGTSKKHSNNGKRRTIHAKKNVRTLYFYDEVGNFRTKRISWIQFYYYRLRKKKLKRVTCLECMEKFKCIGKTICPNCEMPL